MPRKNSGLSAHNWLINFWLNLLSHGHVMLTSCVNIFTNFAKKMTHYAELSQHMHSLSRGKLVKTSVTGTTFERAQTASCTAETFNTLLRGNYSPRRAKYVSGCACLPVHSSLLRFPHEENILLKRNVLVKNIVLFAVYGIFWSISLMHWPCWVKKNYNRKKKIL